MPHSSTSTIGEFHPTGSPEHVSTHYCGNAYYSPYLSSSSCPPRLGISWSFISGSLCRQLKIPTAVNPKTYQIQSITGKSLSRHNVRYLAGPITLRVGLLHEENIQLLVLEEANTDIILGRPWFTVHEPQIVWRTGDILKWGNQCFPDCFPSLPRPSPPAKPILSLNAMSIESPVDQQSVDIPYSHFSDVFCPKKASQLPPHRPRDCAIYLLPG